jgi:hypothetical protein
MVQSAVNPSTQQAATKAEQLQKQEEFERDKVKGAMKRQQIEAMTRLEAAKMDTEQKKLDREEQKRASEAGLAETKRANEAREATSQARADNEKAAAEAAGARAQESLDMRKEELAAAEAQKERDRVKESLETKKELEEYEKTIKYKNGLAVEIAEQSDLQDEIDSYADPQKYGPDGKPIAGTGGKLAEKQHQTMLKVGEIYSRRKIARETIVGLMIGEQGQEGMDPEGIAEAAARKWQASEADMYTVIGNPDGDTRSPHGWINDFVDQNGKVKSRAEFLKDIREGKSSHFAPEDIEEAERAYRAADPDGKGTDKDKGAWGSVRRDTEGYQYQGSKQEKRGMARTFLENNWSDATKGHPKARDLLNDDVHKGMDLLMRVTNLRDNGLEDLARQAEGELADHLKKTGTGEVLYTFVETNREALQNYVQSDRDGRGSVQSAAEGEYVIDEFSGEPMRKPKHPHVVRDKAMLGTVDGLVNIESNLRGAAPWLRSSYDIADLTGQIMAYQHDKGPEEYNKLMDSIEEKAPWARQALEAGFQEYNELYGEAEGMVDELAERKRKLTMYEALTPGAPGNQAPTGVTEEEIDAAIEAKRAAEAEKAAAAAAAEGDGGGP